MQAYDLMVQGYFCNGFIDFMFYPNSSKMNDKTSFVQFLKLEAIINKKFQVNIDIKTR